MDLATLDAYADKYFLLEERLYFLKVYLDDDQFTVYKWRKLITQIQKLKAKNHYQRT